MMSSLTGKLRGTHDEGRSSICGRIVLRRHRFGRSSEKLDREIEQLEMVLGELEEGVAESKSRAARAEKKASAPAASASEDHKHGRKPMPAHLPRERTVHEPAPTCTACGGTVLRKLGDDVTELLVQIVRPKLSCRDCETIVQAPLPSFPIERGRPGPGLLAHVIVSKYADGLPLYRQSDIYARQNIDLDRSTMADWVGCMAALFDPLVVAIAKHVCAGEVLHADGTTVKVLAPGLGRTKTGRLWAAVRDERAFGGAAPPAAFYRYSAATASPSTRKRCSPTAGAFCTPMAMPGSTISLPRTPRLASRGSPKWPAGHTHGATYTRSMNPQSRRSPRRRWSASPICSPSRRGSMAGRPAERLAVRQQDAVPLLAELKSSFDEALTEVSGKSNLAKAIRYALARWTALTRYTTDGRLEMTNNAVERAIRPLSTRQPGRSYSSSTGRAASIPSCASTSREPENTAVAHPSRRSPLFAAWQADGPIRTSPPL
jgi:transposase